MDGDCTRLQEIQYSLNDQTVFRQFSWQLMTCQSGRICTRKAANAPDPIATDERSWPQTRTSVVSGLFGSGDLLGSGGNGSLRQVGGALSVRLLTWEHEQWTSVMFARH